MEKEGKRQRKKKEKAKWRNGENKAPFHEVFRSVREDRESILR